MATCQQITQLPSLNATQTWCLFQYVVAIVFKNVGLLMCFQAPKHAIFRKSQKVLVACRPSTPLFYHSRQPYSSLRFIWQRTRPQTVVVKVCCRRPNTTTTTTRPHAHPPTQSCLQLLLWTRWVKKQQLKVLVSSPMPQPTTLYLINQTMGIRYAELHHL